MRQIVAIVFQFGIFGKHLLWGISGLFWLFDCDRSCQGQIK